MVAARDRLLDELGSLRVPDGPLEILANYFGTDKLAEVTGRKQRVVRKLDENGQMKTVIEKTRRRREHRRDQRLPGRQESPSWYSRKRAEPAAATTRRTAAAARSARRSHYLVQAGWRADKAVQGFGRTHRTNQASAPLFHLVTTDLEGQKRFISSIARRLGQLGALTKGERKAGDQGLFGLRDNLESAEARAGLTQFFRDVHRGDVKGVTMQDLEKGMGLEADRHPNRGPAGGPPGNEPVPQPRAVAHDRPAEPHVPGVQRSHGSGHRPGGSGRHAGHGRRDLPGRQDHQEERADRLHRTPQRRRDEARAFGGAHQEQPGRLRGYYPGRTQQDGRREAHHVRAEQAQRQRVRGQPRGELHRRQGQHRRSGAAHVAGGLPVHRSEQDRRRQLGAPHAGEGQAAVGQRRSRRWASSARAICT